MSVTETGNAPIDALLEQRCPAVAWSCRHSLPFAAPHPLQVRAEAARVFAPSSGKDGGTAGAPTREAVDGMEYTLAALKESLRKYSVVPVVTRNLVQVRCHLQWLAGSRAAVQLPSLHADVAKVSPPSPALGPLHSGCCCCCWQWHSQQCLGQLIGSNLASCVPCQLCCSPLFALAWPPGLAPHPSVAGGRAARAPAAAWILADRAPAGHPSAVQGSPEVAAGAVHAGRRVRPV